MTVKTVTVIEDDLGGQGEAQTVHFGLDGREYAIDLNDENLKKFHDALDQFVKVARPSGFEETVRRNSRRKSTTTRRTSRATTGPKRQERVVTGPKDADHRAKPEHPSIREWAKDNGYKIGERGRVPAMIRDQYDAAMRDLDTAATG